MKKMQGVVTGIVQDLGDPEGMGRIKLSFPWQSDTQRSSWAPLAVPLAGPGRGMHFMPEPGDEVLVAFEQGDFDHPYIVGFLWNGVQKRPETTNKNRVILTPGGHTLRFEDQSGDQRVILRSSSGHEVTLDDASASITVKTATGGTNIMLNAASIVMTGGGRSLTMSGGSIQIV